MPKCFSAVVRDFITSLLTKDPKKRLGARGSHEVKNHKFFKVNMLQLKRSWIYYARLKESVSVRYFQRVPKEMFYKKNHSLQNNFTWAMDQQF